ncbi:MAG: TolC family protein, partial [Pseudomonadota bacterium]
LDVDSVVANLTANLTQPIFQGGRLRAEARATKADRDAAIYTYADTVLVAYKEVEDALAAEVFLAAQEDAQRTAFEESAASEELTTRQYLNGTRDIFNLINAQQRRITNESQFIAASRARLSNRIDLYLALGAPFKIPAATPQVASRPRTNSKGDRL